MSRDDVCREAADEVAEMIAKDAEAPVALALTRGRSTQVDSETAHQIAAEAARRAERQRR